MKKFLWILLVSIMVISLSACASPNNEKSKAPNTPEIVQPKDYSDINKDNEKEDSEDNKDNRIEGETETNKEAEVNIYYTSEEYAVTSNEDLEKLKPETRTVNYTNMILEEAVVRELFTEPKNEGALNSIPSSVKLIEVTVMDNTAYVNFSKDGMGGGSSQESGTINQIVATLLDLGTVNKVQFLLDGEVGETLMGHISIDEPFDGKSE